MTSVLGVNLAAGVAYLGVVASPNIVVWDRHLKVIPSTNVDDWERLRLFGESVVAEAGACGAVRVAFAGPQKFTWSYKHAFERMSLHTAAGLALRAGGFAVVDVTQRRACSVLGFGIKLKEMESGLAAKLGVDAAKVTHWRERRTAFAVAATIAHELWP